MSSKIARVFFTGMLTLSLLHCGADKSPKIIKNENDSAISETPSHTTNNLKLTAEAFEPGAEIPTVYTCEGQDISPQLEWSGVPEQTESFALIVDDPDAPDPENPKMTWVHLVLYNIPPSIRSLSEGLKNLPPETGLGLNDWQKTGYGGPCPPVGRHRYFFKLYALDSTLDGLTSPKKSQVELAMKEHILAQTQLIGTYQKKNN